MSRPMLLPAHAGMVPPSPPPGRAGRTAPRARGDGPPAMWWMADTIDCSPRTRGWSPATGRRRRSADLLPAHAGMAPRVGGDLVLLDLLSAGGSRPGGSYGSGRVGLCRVGVGPCGLISVGWFEFSGYGCGREGVGVLGAGVEGDGWAAGAVDGAYGEWGEGVASADAAGGGGGCGWFGGEGVAGHAGTPSRAGSYRPGVKGRSWPGVAATAEARCRRCCSHSVSCSLIQWWR
jgi:hypothetical protein